MVADRIVNLLPCDCYCAREVLNPRISDLHFPTCWSGKCFGFNFFSGSTVWGVMTSSRIGRWEGIVLC